MKRCAILPFLAAAMVGCDSLDSPADTQAKEMLRGSWYQEFKDPSERQIRSVVILAESGTFSARERISGEPHEEQSSGPWYVTEGLLKLQTTEIDGKKLGIREMLFFTCKLVDVTSKQFTCEQEGGKRKFTFQRVQSDYALS